MLIQSLIQSNRMYSLSQFYKKYQQMTGWWNCNTPAVLLVQVVLRDLHPLWVPAVLDFLWPRLVLLHPAPESRFRKFKDFSSQFLLAFIEI